MWTRVETEWRDVVLVCRKCSKRLGGGFGPAGDERLAKALRRTLERESGGRRKARRRAIAVVEVGCLDVCPKGAVVALRGRDPGAWLMVPAGAAIPAVAARLGLTASAGERAEDVVAAPQSADVSPRDGRSPARDVVMIPPWTSE